MDRNVCTHEPSERVTVPLGKTGWVTDIKINEIIFGDIVYDYFCNVCKAQVGFFSRLIWRKQQFPNEVET